MFTDVDECATSNGGCNHTCTNSEGSYECSCNAGFVLRADGRNCQDDDECRRSPCSHGCINVHGGFRCECPPGYTLGVNRTTCFGKTESQNLKDKVK